MLVGAVQRHRHQHLQREVGGQPLATLEEQPAQAAGHRREHDVVDRRLGPATSGPDLVEPGAHPGEAAGAGERRVERGAGCQQSLVDHGAGALCDHAGRPRRARGVERKAGDGARGPHRIGQSVAQAGGEQRQGVGRSCG